MHRVEYPEKLEYVFNTNAYTGDRDASNDRTIKGFAADDGLPYLRLPCEVHNCSVSQGRSFNAVAADISGVIGVGLAQRPLGEDLKLRGILEDTIESSVAPHQGPPPVDHHPHI